MGGRQGARNGDGFLDRSMRQRFDDRNGNGFADIEDEFLPFLLQVDVTTGGALLPLR